MRRFSSNDGMYDDSTDGDYVQHSDAMVFVRRVEELRVFEQSSIKNAIRVVELEADLKVVRAFLTRAETRIAELEADRSVLQSTGEHPAPCARHCEANAFRIELRNKDARIAELDKRVAELERKLSESRSANGRWARGMDYVGALETRIAELEKQAAIDKTLLALADARINRELRDDFAGRAMQGILAQPGMTVDIDGDYIGQCRAELAYGLADALLKAKGGA